MGYVNAVKAFGRKSSISVDKFNVFLFDHNDQVKDPCVRPNGIVFHWTAGTYNQSYDGYHYTVVFDTATGRAHVVKNLNLSDKGQHLWGRNSGKIGIAFAGMKGAVNLTNHMGPWPVVQAMQIEGGRLAAEICAWKHIDPRNSRVEPHKVIRGNQLVPTGRTIIVPVISDHYTWAQHDGYQGSRWDVGGLDGRILDDTAEELLKHYDGLKTGRHSFQYLGIIKE